MFTKMFCQVKQITLKTNTLFDSAAYWNYFEGALIFELHFDSKPLAQSSV